MAQRNSIGANRRDDGPLELLADDLIRACNGVGMTNLDILGLVEDRLKSKKD